MIGGKLIGHNDPDHQEHVVKFNELLASGSGVPVGTSRYSGSSLARLVTSTHPAAAA
jgi:hypothetical protein